MFGVVSELPTFQRDESVYEASSKISAATFKMDNFFGFTKVGASTGLCPGLSTTSAYNRERRWGGPPLRSQAVGGLSSAVLLDGEDPQATMMTVTDQVGEN